MTSKERARQLFNTLKQEIKKLPLGSQIKIASTADFDTLPEDAQQAIVRVVEDMVAP